MTVARWAKAVPDAFEDVWAEYERELRRLKRSHKTITMNRDGWQRMTLYVTSERGAVSPFDVTREDVYAWVESMQNDGEDDGSIDIWIREARPFYSWLAEERDVVSPFHGAKLPSTPDRSVEVITVGDLRLLIEACAVPRAAGHWERFVPMRDESLVRGFFDLGTRCGEMHGMSRFHWNTRLDLVSIKNSKTYERDLVISEETATAWARYLRELNKHNLTHDAMWVSRRLTPLTQNGINQAVARVSIKALGRRLKPHAFRHTSAHQFLLNGGEEGALVRKMGWTGRSMVDVYGRSVADERSRKAQREIGLGNLIR